MKNFDIAMDNLFKLEFNSPRNELHKNLGESTYTYMGIYPYTKLQSHTKITKAIHDFDTLCDASLHLHYCQHDSLLDEVKTFYRVEFWDKSRLYLDELPTTLSVKIFLFLVNVGINKAQEVAKAIQTILGNVLVDGWFGNITLETINNANLDDLIVKFNKYQTSYYTTLANNNPKLAWALVGWKHRANHNVELPSNYQEYIELHNSIKLTPR